MRIVDLKTLNDLLNKHKDSFEKLINNDNFYNNFLKDIKISLLSNNNKAYIVIDNDFALNTIKNNYENDINVLFKNLTNLLVDLVFINSEELNNLNEKINKLSKNRKIINLMSNCNFDNFLVSDFNKQAYNAAKSLFSNMNFNPILIYGGVGLGKTHLLHAIGNEYAKTFPNKNILFVSCDQFVRDIFMALSSKDGHKIEDLKDYYTSFDLLLIDDIQFLANKEKTNEIFFNIFNNCINNNKIIIMTSDRSPDNMVNIEERLRSRILSGLYMKINKPDLESMKNILKNKMKFLDFDYQLTNDSIDYIVRRNPDDIRRLEGSLNKILFYSINNLPPKSIITSDIIKNFIEIDSKKDLHEKGFDIDPELILKTVCSVYNVNVNLVKSKTRVKQIVMVRQVCMYILRKRFNMSLSQIGSLFSNRSHVTVLQSIEAIENLIKTDHSFGEFINSIYKKI